MGILDDLKMGLGFKEKDRDYYDRTEKTLRRTQGDNRADQYREYLGKGSGPFATVTSKSNPRYGQQARDQSGNPYRTHAGRYADAPNYSSPTGPQVSDFRQGSRPSNAPTPGTFSHSMGQMPGMIGLLARIFNGSGNNMPEQPLMSNAQRQVRPRRRGATQAASPTSGYNAPPITETPLTAMSTQMSAGPNMMTNAGAMPGMQFSPYDASGTFMEMSQPDDNIEGVIGGMPAMPATDVDAPFARRMAGMAIDAPADFFPTADGVVMADSLEADEAAYQQWLSTEGSNKLIQQWDKTNPGFSRRMYDTAKRIKAGKF
tara:strand:- start:159 stop:1106 length:948 start_codon:yes stop_codon:yes gene_type:complete